VKFITVLAIKSFEQGKWEDLATHVHPHFSTFVAISVDSIESIKQEDICGEPAVLICTRSGGAFVVKGEVDELMQDIEEEEA
jgi:hypothetical protein